MSFSWANLVTPTSVSVSTPSCGFSTEVFRALARLRLLIPPRPTKSGCFGHLDYQVSYILYLVDEDWDSGEKPDGGGLQLYPLEREGVPGTPAYAPSKTIRPRWNQMVLFAVQPGRSFHDVQEV